MRISKIVETERLFLREFQLADAVFVLKLVNTPTWLTFIGDKNIRTLTEAEEYLQSSLLKSYEENGFGLWLVGLKETGIPIGMCGLVNRPSLDDVDIGFAILPEYTALGYGFEAATATMNYAKNHLKLTKVLAITNPNNVASIALLTKIGLQFERTLMLSEKDAVLVFSTTENMKDRIAIDALTTAFFDLFTNVNQRIPRVRKIKELFIPKGMITNNTNGIPEVFNLIEFITPREKILTNGTLTDFQEQELSNKTTIFGNIAQRFSLYEKRGKLDGVYFESRGMKTIQFTKQEGTWKILSVAWSDEQ